MGATLGRVGCDIAQGYAIARPMSVGNFLLWLERPRHPLLDPGRSARY
ncbi:hypothetical protein [Blastococcus saxobsidens]|uniref:EAL domain-containing protein n=1 Tax=Blastococcus saxobsidens (strain DD2) TaxID=1146883 RepID=H6RRZ9_BLASD|nr:hypothetical protein [Blastococcus saxobsidens]CCG02993.1 putative proteine of unknown function [Blastococcus saxobsidens DD2]